MSMVIFIYGADLFRAREKLKELKQKFLEKNNGNSFLISEIDSEGLDLAEFRGKVLSGGLFAEKKMVILKSLQLTAYSLQLLEIIKKIPDETSLIFWQKNEDAKFLKSDLGKFLLKQKYIFRFEPLSGNLLVSWVRERAKFYKCEIDNESAYLVCDILGNDLCKIDLELCKICAFTFGDPTSDSKIKRRVVEQMLVRQREENVFKFIDALAIKNKRLALETLDNEISAGGNELGILGMIARQVRILLQIKSLSAQNLGTEHCSVRTNNALTKAQIATELGIHPYVAQKALGQAKNFHTNELKNIYRQLLQIDMSIKSSSASARAMLERVIFNL